MYCEIEGMKIISEKIDKKQLLDHHHHETEAELLDPDLEGG